ncbi:endonuclease III domain-containing protein [Alkalilimnicola ehrlichii]|uniref:endonuclease III domain-containing protein n=1 Tax=Alkalilimnicola ehrlichii TaxID=351052 RepID=UPI003BA3848D
MTDALTGPRLHAIYRALRDHHGHLDWWPGNGCFEIAVGAVLTQNTAWSNVEKAITRLRERRLLAPEAMLDCPQEALAEVIRPSGYFNVKARRLLALCRAWQDAGGEAGLAALDTATLRQRLLAVHGVGRETADDILLYAFERPVFVIDAYTRRIFSRLGLVDGDPGYEPLRAAFERALGPDVALYNDYHAQIVALGKATCRPRPRCGVCPLADRCPSAESA